jgi:molecular chaperone GrpE (heat shock protein)
MSKARIKLAEEFASTMQQLAAEAEKAVPVEAEIAAEDVKPEEMRKEFAALRERIESLDERFSAGMQKLTSALPAGEINLGECLEKMDENLRSLRNTETVNHRLFNSLHGELKEYRDNFLRDTLQKPFIRDLIVLFDDLTGLASQMQSAGAGSDGRGQGGMMRHWCDNLENAIHSVVEILHRMEVNEIEPKEKVDRSCHRVVSFEPADFAEEDGVILMRVKRGFLWRDQVLRPEEVVAKRFH